ncbi:hypothetical protein [Mycobacteroides chelonae]|uniref:hypothetical protein n=1 Tax=Mycobacteroides chelonae TaxID=1774 RepID=UPI0008A9A6FD|nr:hypothetical protein [Mycobacteroides chelonae]OHU29009.1 hypothetical protein BKG78_23325 [Mycobacteroides chelonae]
MAQLIPYLDLSKPRGQRFAPEVNEEIAEVAPSTLNDGEVKTAKLADGAVTEPKLAPGAVTSPKIANKAVKATNLDDSAVGTPQLAAGAVTAAKAGIGVMAVFDSAGNPLAAKTVVITVSGYQQLNPPDPNTFYEVLAD